MDQKILVSLITFAVLVHISLTLYLFWPFKEGRWGDRLVQDTKAIILYEIQEDDVIHGDLTFNKEDSVQSDSYPSRNKVPDTNEKIPIEERAPRTQTNTPTTEIPSNTYESDPTKEGADIRIVDYVYTGDEIWEEGHITFIPFVKNVGDMYTGKYSVVYYLNGKHSQSFELSGLAPGEYINPFIMGSGFGGNFGLNRDTPMELKLVITPIDWVDQNMNDNEVVWDFDYINSPLPNHTCSYVDNNSGKEDFYDASYIKFDDRILKDKCLDEFHVLEYTCDEYFTNPSDKGLETFMYECPNGCSNGACLEATPIEDDYINNSY